MRPRRITVAALAAGLVLAACGGSDDAAPAEPAPTDAPAPADDGEAAEAGEEAPASASDAPEILQFTADLVGGGTLDASTLAGTPTAFWFWAPT